MKITLEFTDVEKFFTELPRFAALMNISGQFASFDRVPRSESEPSLREPALPELEKGPEGTVVVRGTQEQVGKVREAAEAADKTNSMTSKRKKETAKGKADNDAQEAADAPSKSVAESPTSEAESPAPEAQEPAGGSGEVKDTDVRKIFAKLIKGGHRDAVAEILAEYGAENFSALDKKYFAAALEKAKGVLENGSSN